MTLRCLVAAGCLLAAPLAAAPPEPAAWIAARQRGLDPEVLIWPWQPGATLRGWLERQAVGRRPEERLQVAFHQLVAAGGRGVEYDAGLTATADQVFASGRANRLGLALLFVGMARELGVEAGFFRFDQPNPDGPREPIPLSQLVTAGYRAGGEWRLVEFALGPRVDSRRAVAVSDLTALALYYASRGGEELRRSRPGEAVRWLEVAVRLDDAEAAAWTDLGVARHRLGEPARAEAVLRRAIRLEPGRPAAYIQLARILRPRGEVEAAREIGRLLDRGGGDPETYLALGDASLEEGRPDEARFYFRRAVRQGRSAAGPRAAMGLWALAAGDEESARRWLRRAHRIDRLEPRTVRLEQRLTDSLPPPGEAAAVRPEQSEREVES